MQIGRSSAIYITILFVLVVLSLAATYYRYIVKKDFVYFTTEESIPDRFDLSSYSKL